MTRHKHEPPPSGSAPRAWLQQFSSEHCVDTHGPGFTDITAPVRRWLQSNRTNEGLVTIFVRHTSASLTIQENADPDVREDLRDALDAIAPRTARYRHRMEGPDDMPAHIKSMVTSASLGIPVIDGNMVLGTWQAIYLIEHRDRPHRRHLAFHFIGTVTS